MIANIKIKKNAKFSLEIKNLILISDNFAFFLYN